MSMKLSGKKMGSFTNLSQKFIYLALLKNYQSVYLIVPQFYFIDINKNREYLKQFESLFCGDKKFILRSSIQGEAEDQIGAGKSLSIKNIVSYEDFLISCEKTMKQDKINGLLLQEQVLYDQHMTGAFFDSTLFLENTYEKNQFCYLTQGSHLGDLKISLPVFSIFQRVSDYIEQENFLIEMGFIKDKIYLFQLIKVKKELIKKQILAKESEILNREVGKNKYDFLEELFWVFHSFLLRNSFNRKKLLENDYEKILANWRAIINCYRIFSIFTKTKSFVEYYTWAMEGKSKWAKICKKHFSIATFLSQGAFVSQSFIKNYHKLIFLGHKNKIAEIGREAYLLEQLDPQNVYPLPKHSVVLTRSSHILSHGYLAVVEKNFCLVGNIPLSLWRQLKPGVKVKVSFSQKKFSIL